MLIKKFISPVLYITVLYVLVTNARGVMIFVKEGLMVCYESIIPSLYIFMVLSNIIAQSSVSNIFSVPFIWYSNLMKIKDRKYSAFLFLSLLGGFAVGANLIKKLEQAGYEQKAINVLSVTMINNSFSFCVFAVGTGYLGNTRTGIMLFVSLALASLITGFILSFFIDYNIVSQQKSVSETNASLIECINNAVQSVLSICGFVIIFYCACEVVSLYTLNNNLFTLISGIFLEVTSGCLKIIDIYGKNLYLLCFCLSFLPASTICQVYYFTENPHIIRTLIASRIIHTPVSLLILSLLVNFFPVAATVSSNLVLTVKAYQRSAEISSVIFLITVIFLMIIDRNRLFTKTE